MAFLFSPLVKNTDYVIRIATKRGRSWTYAKDADTWTQITPAGRVRRMSAEQLLSHLLPPLAKDQPHLNVTVEPKAAAPVIPAGLSVIPTAVEESLTVSRFPKP